jgi:hypothetical protein
MSDASSPRCPSLETLEHLHRLFGGGLIPLDQVLVSLLLQLRQLLLGGLLQELADGPGAVEGLDVIHNGGGEGNIQAGVGHCNLSSKNENTFYLDSTPQSTP